MKFTRLLLALVWLVVLAHPAAGEKAGDAAWDATVKRFADGLSSGWDSERIRGAFSDRFTARDLQGGASGFEQLAEMAAGSGWVKSLSYADTPDLLAAEIATAIEDAPVPDALKRYLTPEDEVDTRRANITAMKWIVQLLNPRGEQPVAVILLHKPDINSAHPESPGRLMVVLLAGDLVGPDQYRFRQLAFGEFNPVRR